MVGVSGSFVLTNSLLSFRQRALKQIASIFKIFKKPTRRFTAE
jgi:hypothetical protein